MCIPQDRSRSQACREFGTFQLQRLITLPCASLGTRAHTPCPSLCLKQHLQTDRSFRESTNLANHSLASTNPKAKTGFALEPRKWDNLSLYSCVMLIQNGSRINYLPFPLKWELWILSWRGQDVVLEINGQWLTFSPLVLQPGPIGCFLVYFSIFLFSRQFSTCLYFDHIHLFFFFYWALYSQVVSPLLSFSVSLSLYLSVSVSLWQRQR